MKLWALFAFILINFSLFFSACSDDDKNAGGTSEADNSIAITDKTVAGVSQKGPFTNGSVVTLYELNFNTRAQTGKSFFGKISDDKGSFLINNIELTSQYALLKADGFYRNEITGKVSTSQITLNAISDLSERDKVNINLLTHLEYERAVWLAQEKEITISDAKDEADQEIFAAFGVEYDGYHFEDLNIFGSSDADAALLAISVIMHAGRSEGEFSQALADLATDLQKDGKWSDSSSIANAADNSFEADTIQIRKNIERWKISNAIPDFAPIMEYFWNNVFDLGRCIALREGEIRANGNPHSKYYGKHFVCENEHWLLTEKTTISSSSIESSSNSAAESSSSVAENDTTTETVSSSSTGNIQNSENSSSSVKRSSSSRQSTSVIVYPDQDDSHAVDPELLDSLGTCDAENENMIKVVFDISFICKDELWYNILLNDMEQDSWFNPDIEYGTLTDERDGRTYRTVTIGTQKWMAENLHYDGENASEELAANMAEEILCLSGDEDYCEKAGYVYSWTAAMNISYVYTKRIYSTVPIDDVHQGICPDGWHIPTEDEWRTLLEYVTPNYKSFDPLRTYKLKSLNGWIYNERDYAPTNETGFSALATGCDGGWNGEEMGQCSFFTSATYSASFGSSVYFGVQFYYWTDEADIGGRSLDRKASVRCVEDSQ